MDYLFKRLTNGVKFDKQKYLSDAIKLQVTLVLIFIIEACHKSRHMECSSYLHFFYIPQIVKGGESEIRVEEQETQQNPSRSRKRSRFGKSEDEDMSVGVVRFGTTQSSIDEPAVKNKKKDAIAKRRIHQEKVEWIWIKCQMVTRHISC